MKILRKQYYVQLDGKGIKLPKPPVVPKPGDFTFSAWIRPEPPQKPSTMELWSPESAGVTIAWEAVALVVRREKREYKSDAAVPAHQWAFVSVTYDAGKDTLSFFVNGKTAGTVTDAPKLTLGRKAVTVGQGFVGGLAAWGIWQEARHPWNLGYDLGHLHRNLQDPSLLAAWPLEEGEGTEIQAIGPAASPAALAGGIWHDAGQSIFIWPPKGKMRVRTIPLRLDQLRKRGEEYQEPTTPPVSGENGEATKFMMRTSNWVSNKLANTEIAANRKIAREESIGEMRIQQALRKASSLYNSGRFDRLWFVAQDIIWLAKDTGEVAPYRGSDGIQAIDLVMDASNNYLFYCQFIAEESEYRLVRRTISGDVLSDPRELLSSTTAEFVSLALDTGKKKVFIMFGDGSIQKLPYSGGQSNLTQYMPPARKPKKEGLWQMAYDESNKQLYWTDDFNIWKNGGANQTPTLVISNTVSPYPLDLTLNPAEGKLYWVDKELGQVRRANLDGSQAENLHAAPGVGRGLTLDASAPVAEGLAQNVYWVNQDTQLSGQTPGLVGALPLDETKGNKVQNQALPHHSVPFGIARETVDLPTNLNKRAFAWTFSGSDLAWVPPRLTHALMNSSFSISMWVKPVQLSAGVNQPLLVAAYGNTVPLVLSLNGTVPQMQMEGKTLEGTDITPQLWTHLTFRYTFDSGRNKGVMAIIINADAEQTREKNNVSPLDLGNYPGQHWTLAYQRQGNSDQYYQGLMTDFRLLPQALNLVDIQQIMLEENITRTQRAVRTHALRSKDFSPPLINPVVSSMGFNWGQYQALGTTTGLGLLGKDLTLELWALPYVYSLAQGAIVGTAAVDGNGFSIQLSDGKPVFKILGKTLTSNQRVEGNKWVHLAVRLDREAKTMRIFINGQVDVTKRNVSLTNELAATRIYLARKQGQILYKGLVSNVRLWTVARTDDQISQNYRQYQESF
ncbi:MAG: LamG-like jellyroll fold domain-containing protein, partial [Bacteroidota bacterium]